MMVSLSLGSRTIVKTRARLRLFPAHPPTSEATSSPSPIPGPVERRIIYVPPLDRCDRETDYRTA